MEQRKSKWHEPALTGQIDQLLSGRYGQLLKWGAILTRGDTGKAQEIVQELCLYFVLTKPDLSGVANLDGYLHTCLRHIYLSALARASRDAQRFISIAEFDSFESALGANHSGDSLQRQNDLRRICGYAVWRKESSKTASYFIFHFFHGYSRKEIAETACIPITAVYNKLKAARSEVKSHLEEAGKLRIMNHDTPPEPVLSWGLVSSAELFKELRERIMRARASDCLSEEDLLARYNAPIAAPIRCDLLAHIVSCSRCLAIIDRHFRRPTLHDREPLDGAGSSSGLRNESTSGFDGENSKAMLRAIHRRWGSVHEHRPKTLSIAINGRIVAVHDVQAAHNMLSARIEQPERAQFVEVFSEQDVRLALISIGDLPPEGSAIRSQHVSLSDARWLELKLTFDGLGLDSQVAYFDPALVGETFEGMEDSAEAWMPERRSLSHASHEQTLSGRTWASAINRFLRPLIPSSAIAWALVLTIMIGSGAFMAYRRAAAPIDGMRIMEQALKTETTSLRGQTEHQVLQLEEVSLDGTVLQRGVVDLWKDGDGRRYMRRLYDPQHRLIAVEWRNRNGERESRLEGENKHESEARNQLLANGLWDQDVSAHAFQKLGNASSQLHTIAEGYELTTVGPLAGHPELISATLVLDRHLLPTSEIVRFHSGSQTRELRLVQVAYERRPSSSVSDAIFTPDAELGSAKSSHSSVWHDESSNSTELDLRLAELQIAVLHQLNVLEADTGEPIEVVKTQDGHIRVSGAVSDSVLRQEISSSLDKLSNHQLVELRLIAPNDARVQIPTSSRAASEDSRIYDVERMKPETDAALRKHFQTKGLSGEELDNTIRQYSNNVLGNAQRALQHAYALNRLGSALSNVRVESIGEVSQRQWAEMVDKHANELDTALRALRGQLAEINTSGGMPPDAEGSYIRIENPTQFNEVAGSLLSQMQKVNTNVGELFTSNATVEGLPTEESLLAATINAIPLRQSREITRFASDLNSRGGLATPDRLSNEDDKRVSNRPR
jgi:DNA-directed RNA polymerase specialized sigma24 family protein